MKINSLEFENFRNLEKNKIFPNHRTNVIYGENAQGKTNLLECMWLFCGGHSFRGSSDKEMIRFGEKFSKIRLEFDSGGRTQNAEIIYQGKKKEVFLNGVKKKSGAELIEQFSCVVFYPEHLSLVKAGPGLRRKFLDGALCQQRLKYAMHYARYNRVLNQRNALLKEINRDYSLVGTLDIWDEHLSMLAEYVIRHRMLYVKKLRELAAGFHSGISGNKEQLSVEYVSTIFKNDVGKISDIRKAMVNRLKEKRTEDLFMGYTTIGPHRDDISILINGTSAKVYGSQGQQRSAVLSLKLAEAAALAQVREEKPVLLFDDVLSELDTGRREYLLNKITGYQVFITCCENIDSTSLEKGKIFEVKNGIVEEKDVSAFG